MTEADDARVAEIAKGLLPSKAAYLRGLVADGTRLWAAAPLKDIFDLGLVRWKRGFYMMEATDLGRAVAAHLARAQDRGERV